MTPQLSYHAMTVPAGAQQSRIFNATGDLFVCKQASEQFDLQFDDAAKIACEAGFAFQYAFDRVVLFNKTSEALTVEFYIGIGPVSYSYNYFQRPIRTLIKPHFNTLVSGSDLFPGTYLGYRRKFFCAQNDHATQSLQLKFASTRCGMIYARQLPVILETDGEIEVHNPTATSVDLCVTEIFHLSP